jgi:hypothetical protein
VKDYPERELVAGYQTDGGCLEVNHDKSKLFLDADGYVSVIQAGEGEIDASQA